MTHPLTEEELGKLVPGKSVLRHKLGAVGAINGPVSGGRLVIREIGHDHHVGDWWHFFTLAGTLTEDGWIEGEWSENPVPGMMVNLRWRGPQSADESPWISDRQDWKVQNDALTITAFRPAQREAGALCRHGHTDPMSLCVACEANSIEAQPEPATGGEVELARPDEVTEAALRTRAKALVVNKGWKPGDKVHLHGVVELLTSFGMDLSRSPKTDRCAYPSCGCDFDAVCDAALGKTSREAG